MDGTIRTGPCIIHPNGRYTSLYSWSGTRGRGRSRGTTHVSFFFPLFAPIIGRRRARESQRGSLSRSSFQTARVGDARYGGGGGGGGARDARRASKSKPLRPCLLGAPLFRSSSACPRLARALARTLARGRLFKAPSAAEGFNETRRPRALAPTPAALAQQTAEARGGGGDALRGAGPDPFAGGARCGRISGPAAQGGRRRCAQGRRGGGGARRGGRGAGEPDRAAVERAAPRVRRGLRGRSRAKRGPSCPSPRAAPRPAPATAPGDSGAEKTLPAVSGRLPWRAGRQTSPSGRGNRQSHGTKRTLLRTPFLSPPSLPATAAKETDSADAGRGEPRASDGQARRA